MSPYQRTIGLANGAVINARVFIGRGVDSKDIDSVLQLFEGEFKKGLDTEGTSGSVQRQIEGDEQRTCYRVHTNDYKAEALVDWRAFFDGVPLRNQTVMEIEMRVQEEENEEEEEEDQKKVMWPVYIERRIIATCDVFIQLASR